MSTTAPTRKGLDPARHLQSLTEMLNRPWGWTPPGVVGCGHRERVLGCVFCALEHQHRVTAERMMSGIVLTEQERLQRQARERIESRAHWQARNRGKMQGVSLRAYVEDALHAVGIVEVVLGATAPLPVRPQGLLGRVLRSDEECEVIQKAEVVLKRSGEWRTRVDWDAKPPVLYVGKVPVRMGFGL